MNKMIKAITIIILLGVINFSCESKAQAEDNVLGEYEFTVNENNDNKAAVVGFKVSNEGPVMIDISLTELTDTEGVVSVYLVNESDRFLLYKPEVSSNSNINDEIDLRAFETYTLLIIPESGGKTKAKIRIWDDSAIDNVTTFAPNIIDKNVNGEEPFYNISLDNEVDQIYTLNAKMAGRLVISYYHHEVNHLYDDTDFENTYAEIMRRNKYRKISELNIDIYEDYECKKKLDTVTFYSKYAYTTKAVELPRKGKFYIKFRLNEKDKSIDPIYLRVKFNLVNGENKSLSKNEEQLVYAGINENLYKIKIEKDGLLKLTLGLGDDGVPHSGTNGVAMMGSITLLDKNKKPISELEDFVIKYEIKFNALFESYEIIQLYKVKKGTYYIQLKTDKVPLNIKYEYEKDPSQSGSSKAKASKLEINGNSKKGVITINDNKDQWFEFTVKTKKKHVINIKQPDVVTSLRITLCDSKGKKLYSADTKNGDLHMYGDLSKGKYYIRISKKDNAGSGTYSINVQAK